MHKSMTTPSNVRVWQYGTTKGGLDKNLKLNTISLPQPKANQHLVQIIAVALNPVDYKPAENPIIRRLFVPNPATPGIDFAGRIVKPAAGSSLKPGQLVFGCPSGSPLAAGALSEYAIAGNDTCVPIPEGLDPVDAATIPVAGLTAYQSIVPRVKKGDKIFINGGSGGTGIFGIQIAKAVGCHVTTSCSTANVELCKSLGADEVVDYKKGNVVDALKARGTTFDHVIDNVGADFKFFWRAHEYTRAGASYVMIAGTPSLGYIWETMKAKIWPGFLGGGKRKIEGFFPAPRVQGLLQIAEWMKIGTVKPVIDQRFAFEDAPKAFTKLKTGRAKGKIIVDVAPQGGKA